MTDPISLCVFCGAKAGRDPSHQALARAVGAAIAARGWRLIYGGGRVGLMGAMADAALAGGAEVIGVIPDGMLVREQGHRGLTRLEVVPDMSVRKQRMVELADGFIALPGGFGTLDELFEVLTLWQTRYLSKPVGLLNAQGYFDRLIAMCEGFIEAGFVAPADFDALLRDVDLERLLDRMFTATA